MEQIERGEKGIARKAGTITVGVSSLPILPRDTTDRNRTSPFAFTGNKFEFRAVGSSESCADANTVLNTIVTWALDDICGRLEEAMKAGGDFNASLEEILRDIVKRHKRILFNGDNYTAEWREEAGRRGLPELKTTPEALQALLADETVALFEKYGVLSRRELRSRYEVYMTRYTETVAIEAKCAVNIVRTMIAPAVLAYAREMADTIRSVEAVNGPGCSRERELLADITEAAGKMLAGIVGLEARIAAGGPAGMLQGMRDLREAADYLEGLVPADKWPLPSYADMMFTF